MNQNTQDLEAKLLAILSEPEKKAEALDAIEKAADGDETLTDDQRATLQALLDVGMPTPADIAIRAECAEHNAEIRAKRQIELALRKERRAKRGKKRNNRRTR